MIPVIAVSRINGQYFAFLAQEVASGAVARQEQIQVGDIFGNDYVVTSGLKTGDHIITSGFQFLVDGAPVKETVEDGATPKAAS